MEQGKTSPVQVMVASVGKGMAEARMELCALLWTAYVVLALCGDGGGSVNMLPIVFSRGISAEMVYINDPNMAKQLNPALDAGVPFMVCVVCCATPRQHTLT